MKYPLVSADPETYEQAKFIDLMQLFKALNGLLELLADIFYRLCLDKTAVDLSAGEKKEYEQNIKGPVMQAQGKYTQFMKQRYWGYGFVLQMIRLLFQDHINYYSRSFRVIYEMFKRASDPSGALHLPGYQATFELWQLFLTQSDQLFVIKKVFSDKFQISVNQTRGGKFANKVFNSM